MTVQQTGHCNLTGKKVLAPKIATSAQTHSPTFVRFNELKERDFLLDVDIDGLILNPEIISGQIDCSTNWSLQFDRKKSFGAKNSN